MRLHILDDGFTFLRSIVGEDLVTGQTLCVDTPLMLNLEVGDQIQNRIDGSLWIYIVVDVQLAMDELPPYIVECLSEEDPHLVRLVKLDEVF